MFFSDIRLLSSVLSLVGQKIPNNAVFSIERLDNLLIRDLSTIQQICVCVYIIALLQLLSNGE